MSGERSFPSFRDFYSFYLSEHANRTSRMGDWRLWWEMLTGKMRF